MKKIIIVIMLAILGLSVNAQTNVSGGIYSSTTWTLAGSPYIITDTVVVFPGVILTIQPGVTVKFDNGKMLDVRGKIIALGTSADSITFTSNATTPTPGIYYGIYDTPDDTLANKYSYCAFKYARDGIEEGSLDTLVIKHSNFYNNITGLLGDGIYNIIDTCNFNNNISYGATFMSFANFNYCNFYNNNNAGINIEYEVNLNNCNINNNGTGVTGFVNAIDIINCNIFDNDTGIYLQTASNDRIISTHIYSNSVEGLDIWTSNGGDSILNCQIINNGIGLNYDGGGAGPSDIIKYNVIDNNNIGILLGGYDSCKIVCNKICNNTTYDLEYTNSTNIKLPGNYWCTTDSAATELVIYDGYDNASYGLVSFMPMDTLCYSTSGIVEILSSSKDKINIYPNPTTDNLTIDVSATLNKPAIIEITNIQGQVIEQQTTNLETTNINVSTLAKGMFFVKVRTEKGVVVKKFIKD